MDLIDRINANYNNLSRVHKRIVDYITDNPDRAWVSSDAQGEVYLLYARAEQHQRYCSPRGAGGS